MTAFNPIAPAILLDPRKQQALVCIRQFLEDCWNFSHDIHYTRGFRRAEPRPTIAAALMCRHTSRFLLEQLKEIDPSWRLAGGTMETKDGRQPQDHWWIENDDTIIDLTAEQFGWERVVVVSRDDTRYQRRPQFCARHWISGLTTTIKQWYGQPSQAWMDHDEQFQQLARASASARQVFRDTWYQAMPLPSVGEPASSPTIRRPIRGPK